VPWNHLAGFHYYCIHKIFIHKGQLLELTICGRSRLLSSTTVASLCRKRVFLFLRQNCFRCCGFSPPEGFPPPPPPPPSPDDGLLHQRTSVIRLKTIKVWATKQAVEAHEILAALSLSLSRFASSRHRFLFCCCCFRKKTIQKKNIQNNIPRIQKTVRKLRESFECQFTYDC